MLSNLCRKYPNANVDVVVFDNISGDMVAKSLVHDSMKDEIKRLGFSSYFCYIKDDSYDRSSRRMKYFNKQVNYVADLFKTKHPDKIICCFTLNKSNRGEKMLYDMLSESINFPIETPYFGYSNKDLSKAMSREGLNLELSKY